MQEALVAVRCYDIQRGMAAMYMEMRDGHASAAESDETLVRLSSSSHGMTQMRLVTHVDLTGASMELDELDKTSSIKLVE